MKYPVGSMSDRFERIGLPGEWYQRVRVDAQGRETREPFDFFRPVRADDPLPESWEQMIAQEAGHLVVVTLNGIPITLVAMTNAEYDAIGRVREWNRPKR